MHKETKTTKTLRSASLAVCSGVLIAISSPGFNFFPGAMAGIALFLFALSNASLKHTVAISTLSGLTTGLIFFTWSLQASHRYSGSLTGEGVIIYLSLCMYHAVWCALFGVVYFLFTRRLKGSFVMMIISTASLWVLWEWLYQHAVPSFPWIITVPYTQWNNLFLLQWASVGGVWIVSFVLAAFGAAICYAFVHGKPNIVFSAIVVLCLVHVAGYVMYASSRNGGDSAVRVSILQENVAAEDRWDYAFVDSLAHIFINLNREAVSQHPQIIAWSETAIPWTFTTDDALLNTVLNITAPSDASHLLGMLTPADEKGDVYNSVYYLKSDGAVTGRYDKQQLLAFLEKPLISSAWQLPFAQSRYKNILSGTRTNVFGTAYGSIGVMICNESLTPTAAVDAARDGAQLLFVPSNDGWFYGSVVDEVHLALTRFRAVETRRDVLVDANLGYAGVIRASGDMEVHAPSGKARSIPVELSTHGGRTFYAQFPGGLLYLTILIFISIIVQRFTKQRRAR